MIRHEKKSIFREANVGILFTEQKNNILLGNI